MLLVMPNLPYFGIAGLFCALVQLREPSAGKDLSNVKISRLLDVRYTVRIDVSYMLGIAHIEVMT